MLWTVAVPGLELADRAGGVLQHVAASLAADAALSLVRLVVLLLLARVVWHRGRLTVAGIALTVAAHALLLTLGAVFTPRAVAGFAQEGVGMALTMLA